MSFVLPLCPLCLFIVTYLMHLTFSKILKRLILFVILLFIISCQGPSKPAKVSEKEAVKEEAVILVPAFNADSALSFVKTQTDFGARVPGTLAHAECADWLKVKLLQYTPNVMIQEFMVLFRKDPIRILSSNW